MADRRRSAAAAATYEHVCRLLAVSVRQDCRSLLHHSNSHPNSFSTQALRCSDEHAVALCAALLATHNASWPLVRRYVRTYLQHFASQSLSFFDANAVAPFPAHHLRTRAAPIRTFDTKPSSFTADFSLNPVLTPRGAAAILAACLLLPQPLTIDVFFNFCPELSSLPMVPWLSFLQTERKRPHRSNLNSSITGLCLDGCQVRAFDSLALSVFHHLEWISLRGTCISNLRRTAEIIDALPTLGAVLISGSPCDLGPLNVVRRHAASIRNTGDYNQDELPRTLEQHLHFHSSNVQKRVPDLRQRIDNSFQTSRTGMLTNPTPVARDPLLRAFLLAVPRTALQYLDEKTVSERDRNLARQSFPGDFDHPTSIDALFAPKSTTKLLKLREFGMIPSRVSSKSSLSHKERPQKRRRTGSPAPPVTDIMAAITAAGIPNVGKASKLSPADSLTVALVATTYVGNAKGQVSQNLQRVREAALSIQKASECERLSMLSSRWQQKPVRELPSEGMIGYREDGFKQRMSAALTNRRGNPRVEYLCQGGDRPRQLEFNPANPSELVYGTEHGYLVVIDEMSGVVKGSCASGGGPGNRTAGNLIRRTSSLEGWKANHLGTQMFDMSAPSGAVYGLSWLNKTSDMFISGVNSGAIHVYDVSRMESGDSGGCRYGCETFDGLTSIHVSADDVRFAVSGRACDVGIFDLNTGKRLETMSECHAESVNVIKFAHHSPHILLTSSFDRCVRKWDLRESRPGGGRRPIFTTFSRTDNVMACFSPDDSYLLVSAVDNEVRQYTACDGRLEREFRMPKSGSNYNFTRSYYMNDRDYIVTGSCQESVVRVYNARTGAFFTEVDMDSRHGSSMNKYYVQTLRANPSNSFCFSAILSSPGDSANEMIASVDLRSR